MIRQVPLPLLAFSFPSPSAYVPRHSTFLPVIIEEVSRSVHPLISGQPLQLCLDLLTFSRTLLLPSPTFSFATLFLSPLSYTLGI